MCLDMTEVSSSGKNYRLRKSRGDLSGRGVKMQNTSKTKKIISK